VTDHVARNPKRFNEEEIAKQKALALTARMSGVSWVGIADEISKTTSDGKPIDEATVRRRYRSAIEDYQVPREEWESYKLKQLAQLELAQSQVMSAILTWRRSVNDHQELTGPISALVRLQERVDRVIGFPSDPPPPPPANAEARGYVLDIVTNQVAHQAMLASMRAIEAQVIDAEVVKDDTD